MDPPQGRRPDYLVLAPVDAPQGGQAVYRRFHPIERWLHFSTMEGFLRLEWWRLLGFQFLHSHAGITHLLFNCIGLFFFGPLVERYLGRKRFLAFYLLCGMFGALAFTTLNIGGIVAESWGFDRVPGLLFNDPGTPLVGASAGVFGVILAGAFLQPNARVVVWFFFPMRLKTMAYGLVGFGRFSPSCETARMLVARPATLVVLWRERISFVAPTICTGSLTFWARWIPPANASASEPPKGQGQDSFEPWPGQR